MSMTSELDSVRQVEPIRNQYAAVKDIIAKYRPEMSRRVKAVLKSKKFPSAHVAEAIGITPGALSRSLTKERGFIVPPSSLPHLSINCLEESCHQTMFLGEAAPTILPRHLATLAQEYARESAAGKSTELRERTAMLLKKDAQLSKLKDLNTKEVIRLRILEQSDENYSTPKDILGTDTDSLVRVALRKYLIDDDYEGKLVTLMYFAFALQTSLDYFLLLDYTQAAPIAYRTRAVMDVAADEPESGPDGEVVVVNDDDFTRFVGMYLQLSDKSGVEALRIAWELLLKA